MSTTLITGATGFIGCRLSELWTSEGRTVRATGIVRNDIEEKRAVALREKGVDLRIADVAQDERFEELVDGVESVVHLAAAQHEANVGYEYFHNINVDGTMKLLQLCEKQGVRRFFYASSIGVYGVHNDHRIDESTPLRPDNNYGRSKVAAEAVLQSYDGPIDVFIGRIGETYGPWDMRLHKLYSGIDRGRFWLVGGSNNLHQPIYVDDLAAMIKKLLGTREAARTPVNLSGDQALETREMCQCIADAVGAPLSRWRIPIWPLLAVAVGMEMTLGKIGIQPPLHRRRLDFFRKSLSFSTDFRDSLLAVPAETDFASGARKTADWYRQNRWL